MQKISGLTILAIIQAQIHYFELVYPNIYFTYELLKSVEEPVLQNQWPLLSRAGPILPAAPKHGTASVATSNSSPAERQREHRALVLCAGYKHKGWA